MAGWTSDSGTRGEERLAHAVPADLVDHLAAEPALAVDHDRAAQVDREVAELVGGAHDAEDLGLLGRRRA